MHDLIEELRRRKDAGTLTADAPGMRGDFQPVSEEAVTLAEQKLGFSLPRILRQIYMGVANGGFGYSYGLLGLQEGMHNEDGDDVVGLYQVFKTRNPDDPFWSWPVNLLPAFALGCGMYHCVDCSVKPYPIVWFEPNPHQDGGPWDDSFIPFCPSLDEYLAAWLDGYDLFQHFLSGD